LLKHRDIDIMEIGGKTASLFYSFSWWGWLFSALLGIYPVSLLGYG